LHHFQCHEVHQQLCWLGDHVKKSIFAGLFLYLPPLHTKLTNKKRSKRKGHVCGEICRWSQGPCGGGTSNILDSTCQHDVDSMLTQATSCQHAVNILDSGSTSIGYVALVLPIYFISIGVQSDETRARNVTYKIDLFKKISSPFTLFVRSFLLTSNHCTIVLYDEFLCSVTVSTVQGTWPRISTWYCPW